MQTRLLLVEPRWFLPEARRVQFARLRERYPNAQFTLIAVTPPQEPDMEHISIPDLRGDRAAIWQTIRRVRQKRYEEAIVIADPARQEFGYLEAKFWAFVARARVRRLGDLKRIGLWNEIADKWRRIVIQRIVVAAIRLFIAVRIRVGRWQDKLAARKAAERAELPTARQRLEAFVYLRQWSRRTGKNTGSLLAAGRAAGVYREVAQQYGWQATRLSPPVPVAAQDGTAWDNALLACPPNRRFDLITGIYALDHPKDPAATLAHIAQLLEPDGCCILRLTAPEKGTAAWYVPEEALQQLAERAGMTVVQNSDSPFEEAAQEIWLQRSQKEAVTP